LLRPATALLELSGRGYRARCRQPLGRRTGSL